MADKTAMDSPFLNTRIILEDLPGMSHQSTDILHILGNLHQENPQWNKANHWYLHPSHKWQQTFVQSTSWRFRVYLRNLKVRGYQLSLTYWGFCSLPGSFGEWIYWEKIWDYNSLVNIWTSRIGEIQIQIWKAKFEQNETHHFSSVGPTNSLVSDHFNSRNTELGFLSFLIHFNPHVLSYACDRRLRSVAKVISKMILLCP